MQQLSDFSIETDNQVLLTFADGSSARYAFDRLPEVLAPNDLHKVKRGLKLRQQFLRRNLPRLIVALTAGGAVAVSLVAAEPGMNDMLRSLMPTQSTHAQTPMVPGSSTIITSPASSSGTGVPATTMPPAPAPSDQSAAASMPPAHAPEPTAPPSIHANPPVPQPAANNVGSTVNRIIKPMTDILGLTH